MSCDSVEQDCLRFRSKGKLYLLIKELRAGSLSSRAPALPERLVVGLLDRDLDSRGRRSGVLARLTQMPWSEHQIAAPAGNSVFAHGPPPLPPYWIEGFVQLRCGHSHVVPGILVWGACVKAAARDTLWARVNQTKRKGEEKKVSLYYPDSIFIPWELLLGFACDHCLHCKTKIAIIPMFLRSEDRWLSLVFSPAWCQMPRLHLSSAHLDSQWFCFPGRLPLCVCSVASVVSDSLWPHGL